MREKVIVLTLFNVSLSFMLFIARITFIFTEKISWLAELGNCCIESANPDINRKVVSASSFCLNI
jgi:hypothetical protein